MERYEIQTLSAEEELKGCPVFAMNHYQWRCVRTPKSFGRIGYLPGKGLYAELWTDEREPLIRALHDREMVCKDSAMEAFFAFPKDGKRPEGTDVLYLNTEINAAGAVYAKWGAHRKGREFFPAKAYASIRAKSDVRENGWRLTFYLPEQFVSELCGHNPFQTGETFYCNFYKISEDQEIEHYAAYAPLGSETPDFHRPQDFAEAAVVEKNDGRNERRN